MEEACRYFEAALRDAQGAGARDYLRESGGPKRQEPKKKGFGLRLIERSAAHELDGKAELDFRPEGLCCTVAFSRKHLAEA